MIQARTTWLKNRGASVLPSSAAIFHEMYVGAQKAVQEGAYKPGLETLRELYGIRVAAERNGVVPTWGESIPALPAVDSALAFLSGDADEDEDDEEPDSDEPEETGELSDGPAPEAGEVAAE